MTSELYLISGHGMEDYVDYESRHVLPKDTYLVALAECGLASKVWQLYSFMKLFADPTQKELLQNPVANKDEIERAVNELAKSPEIPNPVTSLRVYAPGQPYPDIYSNLYANIGKYGQAVAKSGVYKYPMNPSFMSEDPILPDMEITRDTLDRIYEGSLYPPEEMQGKSLLRVPMKQIFKMFGPGVYYFPLCRKPMNTSAFDVEDFKGFLSDSDGVDEDAVSKLTTAAELNAYYMSLPQEVRTKFEKSFSGKDHIESLRNEVKIPAIRAQSATRQKTRAGKRRGKKQTRRRKGFQRKRR